MDENDPLAILLQQGAMPPPGAIPGLQPAAPIQSADRDDDIVIDDDMDETLSERLWGLTEMFPERLRSFTGNTVSFSWSTSKSLYSLACSGMWVVASSAAILALPVMFETERVQMEEQQKLQQNQILLGPNAAVSGPSAIPQAR